MEILTSIKRAGADMIITYGTGCSPLAERLVGGGVLSGHIRLAYKYMLVSWNTTNQCNMFRDHCHRDAGLVDEELTTDQARNLIDGMVRAGFKYDFSGGDLDAPDIYELARYATDKGLRVVWTNGTLITEEVAQDKGLDSWLP